MFTRAVKNVADTRLYARLDGDGGQVLAYQMALHADEELAMVLPLPVAPGAGEEALRFINLERIPEFFANLGERVPVWEDERPRRPVEQDDELTLSSSEPEQATLAVHAVGRYEASFVPTSADFHRLDPRFRLPQDVWRQLGAYRDWAFAVFKLRELPRGRSEAVHPMALSFRTRHRLSIFFPTLHVHDGAVHATAHFDHLLYFQENIGRKRGSLWYLDGEPVVEDRVPLSPGELQYSRSLYEVADKFGKILPGEPRYGRLRWGSHLPAAPSEELLRQSGGVLEVDTPLHGFGISGTLKNRDTWFHCDTI